MIKPGNIYIDKDNVECQVEIVFNDGIIHLRRHNKRHNFGPTMIINKKDLNKHLRRK